MPREGYYLPDRQFVSQNQAELIERANIPRSRFLGSKTRKTAFRQGYLVPFHVEEVLPGDHIKYDVTAYVRMATPLFPTFDNLSIHTFFFFCPSRLLWSNFVKMMGEQANPADSIAFTVPQIEFTAGSPALPINSIFDHMGLPVILAANLSVNVLPFRMYNRVWNAWFRDENVDNSVPELTGNGPDGGSDYALLRRRKTHDYFTSALPWPQKFTAPNVALTGLAPVQGIGTSTLALGGSATNFNETYRTTPLYGKFAQVGTAVLPAGINVAIEQADPGGRPLIYADLAQATGVAINNLRQAFMVQALLERDARGGTRYTELLRSHFGVINPDFRLQRPEYIGGGTTPMNITPVAQTAPDTGSVVGQLGGTGTAVGQHRASYAATEHGYILALINVRSELSYQQGLHRLWTRTSRYDFYWPALASLGEQAILRKEIYCTGVDADDDTVFGYQERWHEYRTMYSDVTGLMRSDYAGTLDAWHLSQDFSAPPGLNSTFLEDNAPMDRILAAGSAAINQQFLADILIRRDAVRPMPTFGTPQTLGRF